MRDKCGIVGAYSRDKSVHVSRQIYYGLYSLQHRGQESAGISAHDGNQLSTYRGMGLVCDVFNNGNVEGIDGNVGIGHVRYSTTGKSKIENSQPMFSNFELGTVAVAHNGDIINSPELRCELELLGYEFESTTDSEVLCHLLTREILKTSNVVESIRNVTKMLNGSYSLVILFNEDLYVVRDPNGIKPLSMGELGDLTMVASETVAFDVLGAKHLRDVEPGEIIRIGDKIESYKLSETEKPRRAHCMFEYVYFARPDSVLDGSSVYNVRLNIGKALSKEFPADADVVMPVPDSAITAAIGFSRESGLGYGEGLLKNRYVGRTFIMPTQVERETSVRLKMNPIRSELEGKSIVLVDDSIVRGTTSKSLVKVLREAGAKEIHLRVGCPPIISPCYYGIAMATKKELIASDKDVEDIRKTLGVDSLGYLSLESLIECIGIEDGNLCVGCLTGEYPTELPKDIKEYEAKRC
ncbi:amidophosphoribosyltransferase [Methanobacterium lacus]|uniref:Amidophosphoribosyltransferase n=1 Tax=Methanobacterium lacus (strain AL-21) TaxID=877455 RepID=F0TBX5_METLA|nr:amidophosphoribosyltransferase [Methanobacterium lacus]ADZ10317.1 amidophosphoribosyltransferase [Methanobacterium lacus]